MGQSHALTTGENTFQSKSDGRRVEIDVYAPAVPGPSWMLFFDAPPGQQLAPGTYTDVATAPDQVPGKGSLRVSGPGGDCNTITGSFTVLDATYGPYGYLTSFDATFEQHCEGVPAALRGEVKVTNPPPPPALTVTLTIEKSASISKGRAVVSGTIRCNRDSNVNPAIVVTVTEQSPSGSATGTDNQLGPGSVCTTKTRPWKAVITSATEASFMGGYADVSASTNVLDEFYSDYRDFSPLIFAGDVETTTVHLSGG